MAETASRGLTLDEIKAGLFGGSKKVNVPNRIIGNRGISSDTHESCVINDTAIGAKLTPVVSFCHELVELAYAIERDRSEKAREWTERCQAVRQFEQLYDSVRDRETQLKRKVITALAKFRVREAKFATLRKRARAHLSEAQQARDQVSRECDIARGRLKALQEETVEMADTVQQQLQHVSSLKEVVKNIPSEKEIVCCTDFQVNQTPQMTALNLELRRLQNEFSQLLTDRENLKARKDELLLTRQKRAQNPANPESFLGALGGTILEDNLRTPRELHIETNRRHSVLVPAIEEAEERVRLLEEELQMEEEKNAQKLADAENRSAELETYLTALRSMLPPQT